MSDTTAPAPRRIAAGVSGKAKSKAPAWTPEQRTNFLTKAEPSLVVDIAGTKLLAERREFSTGSVGYNLTGKLTVMVDGKPVTLQLTANMTAIGSKPDSE